MNAQTRLVRVIGLVVASVVAFPAGAQPAEFLSPDELPVEPLQASSVDDDRVWEDVSYGTGEALFTAIDVDPENPRRLYAGANGAVYLSEDGGQTWLRVLRIRGSSNTRQATEDTATETAVANEVEDRTEDLREELLEELKQQITDDLVAELGDYGETLAEEIAEDLAEQQLDEEGDRLAEDAKADIAKRSRSAQPPSDEDLPLGTTGNQLVEPRTIHRIVALAKGRVLIATGSGLFESKDYGHSFEELVFGVVPAERDVRSVAVHPLRPDVVFAGTLAGLYRTIDGGDVWAEVGGFPGKVAVNDLEVDPAQPLRVLAGTDVGVWRSTDGGDTFLAVSQPTSPLALFTRAVAFDPADPRVCFAGTQEGLFRSLDGGLEWERLEPPGLLTRDIQDFSSLEWGLVVSSSNGVFLSADMGESFRELYAGLDTQDVRRVSASATPLEAYAATGRGLFAYRQPAARARKLRALSEIRTLLAREPLVTEVAAKAIAFAGTDVDVASWRARAQVAPLIPQLVVRWSGLNPLGTPSSQNTSTPFGVPATIYQYMPSDDGLTAQLTWDVMRFFYAERTVETSSVFRRVQQQRSKVLRRVVSTYNARRRLQVSLLQAPPDDLRTFAQKSLQVDELTAVLDGLTNGWFSRAVEASAQTPATAQRSR